jgi:exonuclease VII small subunit
MSELTSAAEIEEKFISLQQHVKDLQQEKDGLESALLEMQKHNPKVNAK